MPAPIRIVDDDPIARTTIQPLLDSYSFPIFSEAKDDKEAVEQVIELKPDIVLLDINQLTLYARKRGNRFSWRRCSKFAT